MHISKKVIRIWSVYQGKLYSVAYIADSNQYDQYLPIAQQMIDSFEIVGSSDISARQFESSDQPSPPELKPRTSFGNDEEESQAAETEDGDSTVSIDPSSSDSLSVLSHRISTDEILDEPTMNIDGEIQNTGMESLDFVRVTATFYDATSSILGSDFTYTEPYTLEPGQTAPFELTVGFGDNLPVDEISAY